MTSLLAIVESVNSANDNAARKLDESTTLGIVPQSDGTFLALTLVASKTLKTRKGAEKWLAGRGYAANGAKL